jgi:hypothetical protein
MRRFDKKDNIRKANLLSEQRYLESKGLINEADKVTSAFSSGKFSDSIVNSAMKNLSEEDDSEQKKEEERQQMINVILGYGGQRQSLENLDRETLLKMLYNIGFDKRDDNPRARAMAKDLYNLLKPKKKGFLGLFEVDKNLNDTYFETLSEALDAVRKKANELGFEIDENAVWTNFGTGGIPYETEKSANIPLLQNGEPILDKRGKEANRYIRVSIYRMSSGRYELTMYKTW